MTAGQASDPVEARIAVLQAAKELSVTMNSQLSQNLGYAVEFSIHRNSQFMLSAQGDRAASLKALVEKIPSLTLVGSEYDKDSDCTYCLFTGRAAQTTE